MATAMIVMEAMPRTMLTRSFPSSTVRAEIGDASILESVPARRSPSRLTTPNCVAKKTNSTAIDAA